MCAQFLIRANIKKISKRLQGIVPHDFSWETHVFPRYKSPVALWEANQRMIKPLAFGLIPFYEKAPKPKKVYHNARVETISEKVTFRKSFSQSRCLVPMDSFLEYIWTGAKTNWLARFYPAEGEELMVAAGIWSRWMSSEGEEIDSFSVITTEPPEFVRETGHERCPLFLKESVWRDWLDPQNTKGIHLNEILKEKEEISFAVENISKQGSLFV